MVDDKDFESLDAYNWWAFVRKCGVYVCRTDYQNGKKRTVAMHRTIMGEPHGMDIDHIDGNPLNNCRSNLRVCTRGEHLRNQKTRGGKKASKYKGVVWRAARNKWSANIRLDGVRKQLGCFATEEQAAEAYNIAAKKMFGEFARPNVI